MQSGITASPALLASFKDLLSAPHLFALLATVSDSPPPSITPLATLPSGGALPHDLDVVLAPHLLPARALYLILRVSPAELALATYVPDAAPVRQKMLLASSRLTLARELGAGHFAHTLLCTSVRDLSSKGWEAHLAHVAAPDPLTEGERGLASVREAEASEAGGSARRGAGYAPHAGRGGAAGAGRRIAVGDGVAEALRDLRPGGLVVLRLEEEERIVLAGSDEVGVRPGEVAGRIAAEGPRYTVYWMLEPEGAGAVFVYTCPAVTGVRERMVYASSRRSAEACVADAGVTIVKKIEATEPSEVTELLLDEFRPKEVEESRAGFARPKRPGRR